MGTGAGFFPGLHLSLGIWVIIAAHTLQNAQARITCASCTVPVQLHREELQLAMRTDPTEQPDTLKNIRVEFKELDQNTGVDDKQETGVSVEVVPPQDVDGVSTTEPGSNEESHSGSDKAGDPQNGEDVALRRAKRSGPEFAEFSESGRAGVDAGAPENRGSLFDGHKQVKSDFRWNRQEGRGNNRQDEPKITSSTFSLTGDSAHNHAVVYWSGQNSSVSNRDLFVSSFFTIHMKSKGILRNSVTHRAETLRSVVSLSCGSLLTGALEATDAHRRTLSPKCQNCAATVNCVRS
ncbi:VPS10 domain containing receptor SorCS1 [Dissostichus eleginoides]|uniref:VPS10 domain containing receptor SorCS1 n=1 Tax=Dissostichus eleginoides TaxID=100907 RepID=A0AAD9B2S7_DISEL|nr:VPS10 domain containing receptor SorCS1 [Dissostichus eleginoides]KAK1875824.1 VPS10 domain containing receptor SorCS1 [Dissostichus eleginoides]